MKKILLPIALLFCAGNHIFGQHEVAKEIARLRDSGTTFLKYDVFADMEGSQAIMIWQQVPLPVQPAPGGKGRTGSINRECIN